ncbi:hypothetical protein CHUAL_009145 [Chamberlinius hualienensis]
MARKKKSNSRTLMMNLSSQHSILPPSVSLSPLINSTPTIETSRKQSYWLNTAQSKRGLKNDAVDKTFIEYSQVKKTKTSCSDNTYQDKNTGLKMVLLSLLPNLLKMSDEQVQQFKCYALAGVDDILSSTTSSYSEI